MRSYSPFPVSALTADIEKEQVQAKQFSDLTNGLAPVPDCLEFSTSADAYQSDVVGI